MPRISSGASGAAISVVAFALFVCAPAPSALAAEPARRSAPDYADRDPPPPDVGEVLLWVPRIVFSPVYFFTEYVIRRPVGAVLIEAERSNLPAALYDFFAFGPDHKAGLAPVAFVDFGVNPSLGVYAFWDDAFFKGDDLRAHAVGWPDEWFGASAVQRIRFGGNKAFALRVAGIRRPDYPFFGLGSRTVEASRSRYGEDTVDGSATFSVSPWRASKIEAGIGVRYASFYDGSYGHDPGILEMARTGAFALPDGLAQGYTAEINQVAAALDSRRPFPESGTGFRLEAEVVQGNGFGPGRQGGWLRYEGGAAGFLDLDGHRRVLSLSARAMFADPLGSAIVPFSELVTLGGDKAPMPGFYLGRMIDRSAAVATLRYAWPIAPFLDGSLQASVGNVFGEHLDGFDVRLTRLSAALGIQSDSSPDSNFQFLVGLGSETFEQGGKVDSFRLAFGTTTGL
ncbi:MAG TPA: hypothetical protein VGI39_17170 [Polyangiaceae bacterium]|jgi:hypothetical protein